MYIITGRTDGILSRHSCHITKLPVRKELKLLQNPQSMGLRGVPLNALESQEICSIVSEGKCALHFPVPNDSGTPENPWVIRCITADISRIFCMMNDDV